MKRLFLLTLIVCAIFTSAFAQDSLFVSASGNDSNSGTSEEQPLKTLSGAFSKAIQQNINKITVIGTLDVNSEGRNNNELQFQLSANISDASREILITGKPDSERAVLSAAGSGKALLSISNNVNIRFENIEISGGEGEYGVGLDINKNARVTIGPNAVIKSNSLFGILLNDGATCIIDGGEIRDNNNCGIYIASEGVLTMNSGTITGNRSELGAGVYISNGAVFEMNGGTITGNTATFVGGVLVEKGGKFTQRRGARVTGNNARNTSNANVNVHRM